MLHVSTLIHGIYIKYLDEKVPSNRNICLVVHDNAGRLRMT